MNEPRTVPARIIAAHVGTFLTAICAVIGMANLTSEAGEIATQRAMLINNDDHTTGNNPNQATFLSLTGNPQVDRILPVLATGGTTEYDYRLVEPSPAKGVPEWHVELGFGTGDRFISAVTIFPALDFDWPNPHRTPTAGTYQQVQPFAHAINFSNGDYGAVSLTIDIPDLPTSVLDYYTPAQVAALPAGATAFTLRTARGLVPEPSTLILISVLFVVLSLRPRVRSAPQRLNG